MKYHQTTSSSYFHFTLKSLPFLKYSLVSTNASIHYWCRQFLGDSFCCLPGPGFSSFVSVKRESEAGHHLGKPHLAVRVLAAMSSAAAKPAKPVLCHACFTFWSKKAHSLSCSEKFHSSCPWFIKCIWVSL